MSQSVFDVEIRVPRYCYTLYDGPSAPVAVCSCLQILHHTEHRTSLSLLLGSCLSLRCLLLVAVDHHNPYERSHNGRAQQGKDNGDADSPDARREEVVERVAWVNEGLLNQLVDIQQVELVGNTIRRVHAV